MMVMVGLGGVGDVITSFISTALAGGVGDCEEVKFSSTPADCGVTLLLPEEEELVPGDLTRGGVGGGLFLSVGVAVR